MALVLYTAINGLWWCTFTSRVIFNRCWLFYCKRIAHNNL